MGTRPVAAQSDGRAAPDRGDGKTDRQFECDEDECRAAPERIEMIERDTQLKELLPKLEAVDRVAVDTEADSLHCYFEKLCLIQISIPGHDYLVDPLTDLDLAPLADALTPKEIVLQGADFDLRLLRRSLGFVATRIFDTVIAARLLGMRSFSLADRKSTRLNSSHG